MKRELAKFASEQIDWILGRNRYAVTFMHGFGKNNSPVITALFGHGYVGTGVDTHNPRIAWAVLAPSDSSR